MERLIHGLCHIAVMVKDIKKSVEFYESVLDFRTILSYTDPDGDLVSFVENEGCVLELFQPPVLPEPRTDGPVDHIAFAVTDIEAVVEELKKRGIRIDNDTVTHWPTCFPNGAKWATFHGPDGEYLEVMEIAPY